MTNIANLPLLPTTVVGSFQKPQYLRNAVKKWRKKEISDADLHGARIRALDAYIERQEKAGLDIFVDAEVEREEMTIYFAEKFAGFEASDWVRSYGNRYYRKPIITDAIRWPGPFTVEFFKLAQERTEKPVKGMFTGPYTMIDWSFDEHYGDREKAVLDIARQYRLEAEALKEAGCQILQIDEPAASVRLDEWDLFCEAIKIITDGLGLYTICHICYGDFENVADFGKVPVDNLDLECSNQNYRFLQGKDPFPQDISAGVIDVHTHKQTSQEAIEERISKLLTLFSAEKIWIDPDCGLRTRPMEDAFEQLRIMVEATKNVRAKIAQKESSLTSVT